MQKKKFLTIITLDKIQKKTNKFGKGLIFIVGMPRSGTTLLEQILCHHIMRFMELENLTILLKQ